jgi:hypothetical protein
MASEADMADVGMATSDRPIHLAGATLRRHRHVCGFFSSREEEYETLLPFIKEGFNRGEKAFHVVDPALKRDHSDRLRDAGIAVEKAESTGQLDLKVWSEAYLRDGHFDKDRMLSFIQQVLEEGRPSFPLTRLVAHMEWALEDRPGVNDVVEYEARLNDLLPRYPDVVVCTYDTAKFGGQVVMDVLRTHPLIIIAGLLQENPFFTPPDQFLAELRAREAR